MEGKSKEEEDIIRKDLLSRKFPAPLERLKQIYSQPWKLTPVARKPRPKNDDPVGPDSKTFGNTSTGYIPPWWRGEDAAYHSAKKAMSGITSLPKMKK